MYVSLRNNNSNMIGVNCIHLKSNADIMRFDWMKQQHNSATHQYSPHYILSISRYYDCNNSANIIGTVYYCYTNTHLTAEHFSATADEWKRQQTMMHDYSFSISKQDNHKLLTQMSNIPFLWYWRYVFLEEFKETVCICWIFVFSKNTNWPDLNNNGRFWITSTTHLQTWINCNWYTLQNTVKTNAVIIPFQYIFFEVQGV